MDGQTRSRSPVALILVRNAVTHDARVHREASTLRALGYDVRIAGVVSANAPEPHSEVDGIEVVRLDPRAMFRRPAIGAGGGAQNRVPEANAPGRARDRPDLLRRSRRLLVTCAYHLKGAGLVWRTSPALVHANDFNTMWIAVAAKLLRGSRVIYDSHELWPDRNRRPEWRPWLLACEALFVRAADATITTSPGYAQAIAARYRVPEPMVIRNIPPPARRSPEHDPRHGAPVAVYVGGLMPGRGLEQSIQALATVRDLRLRFIGPGSEPYRAHLRRCAEAEGIADRVEVVPAVAPGAVVDAVSAADLGLLLIQPICRSYELTLPNKLFEYAAAGLPMLASDLPVIGALVESEGLGAVVAPDNVARISAAMRALIEPQRNAEVRARVRSFADRVTWKRERRLLEQLYTSLMPARDGSQVEQAYASYRRSPRKQRSWSADNAGNAAIRRELVDAVFALTGPELSSARRILDLGSGTGWWLARLASESGVTARLYGVDLLPERVGAALVRVPEANVEVADIRRLPHPDEYFDVVTLFTVLSSLPERADVATALAEARRVLAPGGALLIWEPRWPNPLNPRTRLVMSRDLHASLYGCRIRPPHDHGASSARPPARTAHGHVVPVTHADRPATHPPADGRAARWP